MKKTCHGFIHKNVKKIAVKRMDSKLTQRALGLGPSCSSRRAAARSESTENEMDQVSTNGLNFVNSQ